MSIELIAKRKKGRIRLRLTKEKFDRAAWLEERRNAIGASDVAAILGLNPWCSAWDVWASKRGIVEDWEGSEATDLGNKFERVVLDVAEKDLGELRRNVRIKHPSLPVAATLDAQVVSSTEPVEGKTTGLVGPVYGEWGDKGSDVVPETYLVQAHTQLLCVPSASVCHVYALIGGRGVVPYAVPRSDSTCEMLGNILSDWWHKHVINGVEPSRELASFEVVKRLRKVPNKIIVMPEGLDDLVDKRAILKEEIKEREEQIEQIEKTLLLDLGDAEEGVFMSGRSISYYQQHRKGFTVEPSDFRVMRIKKAPKKK